MKNDNFVENLLIKSNELYATKKFKEVIRVYKQILEIKTDNNEIWYRMGDAYRCLNEPEQAINAYKKAFNIQPDDYRPLYWQGLLLFNNSKYQEAEKCFSHLISNFSENKHFICLYGRTLIALGQYEETIEHFDKHIQYNELSYEILYYKAIAYQYLEAYDNALIYYQKAINSYSSSPNSDSIINKIYKDYAYLLLSSNLNEEAIKIYEKILDIDSNDYESYFYKGRAFFRLKKYTQAIEYFNQAIRIQKDYTDAWFWRIKCLKKKWHFIAAYRQQHKFSRLFAKESRRIMDANIKNTFIKRLIHWLERD